MANSSSSKYVKRRRHRDKHIHTKSRRHAKKYTIKKVMHGCNSRQNGGAVTEVPMPHNAAMLGGKGNIVNAAINYKAIENLSLAQARGNGHAQGGNPPEYKPTFTQSFTNAQKGGYKSKHRRRHYKKSIGRKGRSRRFRGSRK